MPLHSLKHFQWTNVVCNSNSKFISGQGMCSNDNVEKTYILKIPYVGMPSLLLKRKLTKLIKTNYDVKLCCVFEPFKVI